MLNHISDYLKRQRGPVLLGTLGLALLIGTTACEQREETAGEKLGNAVDEIGDGIDNAADEMDNDSPAEEVGEDLDETVDELKERTE